VTVAALVNVGMLLMRLRWCGRRGDNIGLRSRCGCLRAAQPAVRAASGRIMTSFRVCRAALSAAWLCLARTVHSALSFRCWYHAADRLLVMAKGMVRIVMLMLSA